MDKNAIKKYAVWARRELISRVSQRAALYEITDKGFGDASADSVLGRVMSAEEKRQRQALIVQIREKGYEQVMEEISYTWFNRFIALRFMEVNGYLPSRVRVFTDDENNFKPQIMTEAINMELDGLDMEKVYALKNANDDDALFKYMIIVQCNALSNILPGMFQRISDFTELLFPDNLLREGSVIEQMVAMIPEEDWTDQVQIIGWLYQYYNTEPKDKVFADLKKNIKISKENIPAATQLFTPDWIVRYMVENSLGRIWLEGHPNDELKASWKYYLDEAEQEPDVQAQLVEIQKEYAVLKPEDILAIDPCQGSGHILAYMFDVLVQIYESYGYTAREAAASIVEHNLWGLDIDDRAAQLAYFSVMMKARQYDRRFFSRGLQPHVYAIHESAFVQEEAKKVFSNGDEDAKNQLELLLSLFSDAKEYGSLLEIGTIDLNLIERRISELRGELQSNLYSYGLIETITPIISVAKALSQKYHVVVTNPPYMAASNGSESLNAFIKSRYSTARVDLYSVFIERCAHLLLPLGIQSMVTMHGWMFLTSFLQLREFLNHLDIVNMIHLGARAFEEISGEVVQTTSFTIRNTDIKKYKGKYIRLVDYGTKEKEEEFFSPSNAHTSSKEVFKFIPSNAYAYWISPRMQELFSYPNIDTIGTTRHGMTTGNNDRFLRLWHEVNFRKIGFGLRDTEDADRSNKKWFPYNKGGLYRKWYGNNEYIVNYEHDGVEMKEFTSHLPQGTWVRVMSREYYFLPALTWTKTSTKTFGVRYSPQGAIFDVAGSCLFPYQKDKYYYVLGLLNTKIAFNFLRMLNPTLSIQTGDIKNLPYIEDKVSQVSELVEKAIELSKSEWDFYEVSWDFSMHPFLLIKNRFEMNGDTFLHDIYAKWENLCDENFELLRQYETDINRLFIETYGLDNELSPDVSDDDVTVRKSNLARDIKSFISYAVGCMLGRYSLDYPGIIFAGGEWDTSRYSTYMADYDSILPICDDEYFDDDIVSRFIVFVKTVFGENTLEANLQFIADAIGGKGSPREVIRNYFINDFYTDHLKLYQKRPIYWLFDSGKKNGFKCLIYMHRYQPDTIARIRTDYVHEQQSRYRTAIADLEGRIASAGTGERVKLSKQLGKLQDQAEELRVYEEKIHHLADQMIRIDLDDGVKHNYAIFQDVLAKIK